MQDKIHQPYRQLLVPGLAEILTLTYKDIDGLLGVCLSGAGPCILALCSHSFEEIGKKIVGIFEKNQINNRAITASYEVLEFARDGLVVTKG